MTDTSKMGFRPEPGAAVSLGSGFRPDPEVSITFVTELFKQTNLMVWFTSLPNTRDDPTQRGPVNLATRTPADVIAFVRKWDRPGRGLFFAVSTQAGARSKKNSRELPALHVDIDFKSVDATPTEVVAAIGGLLHPPTFAVSSGHGMHLYWLLAPAVDAQAEQVRVESLLHLLADHVGGDPAVCEISRLMRLPGTHNTKDGDALPVTAIKTSQATYTLATFEEWLRPPTAPALRRRAEPAKSQAPSADRPPVKDDTNSPACEEPTSSDVGSPRAVPLADPYRAAASRQGFKPPLDIEARLAAMTYQGAGETGIHVTQVAVSASMIGHGVNEHDVVELLLHTTKRAAGAAGAKWDWRKEELSLRKMCRSWLAKHPELVPEEVATRPLANQKVPEEVMEKTDPETGEVFSMSWDPSNEGEKINEAGAERVVSLGTERAKRKPGRPAGSTNKKGKPNHITLAKITLEVMQERGEALLLTHKQGDYTYRDGLWRMENKDTLAALLDRALEVAARALQWPTKSNLINEARKYILRSAELYQDTVLFDAHGQVPTKSGLVDPRTGAVTPTALDHYATWRIEADYHAAATCPLWLQMLDDAFVDRAPEVRILNIALLQELLGVGLLDKRSKALSKALVLLGGTDTGKSGILNVMAGLFGSDLNTTPMKLLDDNAHGTAPFIERRPWVLHEAFNQNQWHMSAVVKSIISGDAINMNPKGSAMLTRPARGPIFWASNHDPQFAEATGAIVERLAIVKCHRVFVKDNPVGVALEAHRRGFSEPDQLVLATEHTGLLAWAMAGLQRALARGHFVLPEETKEAAREVYSDSNRVVRFLSECTSYDPESMVSTPDFSLAYIAWFQDFKSDNRSAPSGDQIGKAMRSLADPRIALDRAELRMENRRFYAGIRLNKDGIAYWKTAMMSDDYPFTGRKTHATKLPMEPNLGIPEQWGSKKSVAVMRAAQADALKKGGQQAGQNPGQSENSQPDQEVEGGP